MLLQGLIWEVRGGCVAQNGGGGGGFNVLLQGLIWGCGGWWAAPRGAGGLCYSQGGIEG